MVLVYERPGLSGPGTHIPPIVFSGVALTTRLRG